MKKLCQYFGNIICNLTENLAGFCKCVAEHEHNLVTLPGIAYRIGVIKQCCHMVQFCMLVCKKNLVQHYRKIVVIRRDFKRLNNILNSEILVNLIRKMKYLTDQFQFCFIFALATLNNIDLVETVNFVTETSLNIEIEALSKIPRPRLQILWILPKFFKRNVVTTS